MKARVRLVPPQGLGGQDHLVEVDGVEIKEVHSVGIRQTAGCMPVMDIELWLNHCEIDMEGKVYFNYEPVSDDIAFEVYRKLKSKFEPENRG